MRHVTIYREADRYAGWPANYGIWSWGDEIVVGFTVGYHSATGGFHSRDMTRPFASMQARSLDGGHTWDVRETPCRTPGGRGLSADEHMRPDLAVAQAMLDDEALPDCPGGIDFSHPDFALMCARSGLRTGARSWFYASTDRCISWDGPFALPDFGQLGIAARTDYVVNGPRECTLFLTATKPNGGEGRVFSARTRNGGESFEFVSWVGPEAPEGFAIMPASVRLPDGGILVALRCRGGTRNTRSERNWIDLYRSDDGYTWSLLSTPVGSTGVGGNPPAMIRLQDGRLCCTYGYRDPPFAIMARVSEDGGRSWGSEIVLRDGGGNHDIGYTRTVQRADGRVVTVFYFNDNPEGERHIAATIWEP